MPVIEELLDLILVALKNERDAKPDLFDNYPVDPKRHIVVGQLPLRLRHFRNLLNRISDSLSDMDVDTSEYNILATAYKGMTGPL